MKGVLRVEPSGSAGKRKRDEGGQQQQQLEELLQRHFGHPSFRGKQLQAIQTVLSGRDCFCLMPTGGGKSICYEIPALAKPGIVLVVSPLIALMEDQVAALKSHNIPAEFLSSSQTAAVRNKVYAEIESGSPSLKLLYATPELLSTSFFMGKLRKLHGRGLLTLLAIDEAHCISSWGHDFRPSYRKLSALRSSLPDVPILALTATASKKVRDDVVKSLSLQNPAILVSSFNRPNIFYEVRYKDLLKNSYEDLLHLLSKKPVVCSIIYCHARATCDEIGARLHADGISCRVYHAGISDKCRSGALKDWASGKVPVIIATVAFGMGIDRKDVGLVCHFNIPKSLESFYQESGRAGRDGQPARSIMYYSVDDRKTMEFVIRSSLERRKSRKGEADADSMKNDVESFQSVVSYCEEAVCRRCKLLEHFGERASPEICSKNCDVCKFPKRVSADLSELQLASCTIRPSERISTTCSQEQSEFWSYENENDDDEEPNEEIQSSDGEEKQIAEAATSKAGKGFENRIAALVQAEDKYYDKQGTGKKKNAATNIVSGEHRDATKTRLENALKAAIQRLGTTEINASAGARAMEEECFRKYGKCAKTFYNSQLASTVRWLSSCSPEQLKTRLKC